MSTNTQKKENTAPQEQAFSADVSRLLDIVANALYTNQDVFLRELISNAADACDRLRYEAIAAPALTAGRPDFRVCVYKDTTARTVCVVDNGIGMSAQEMAENLGTIAKSGTAAMMEQVKAQGKAAEPLKLIGQFGVGFYAGFMVAHRMEVVSRKAGEDGIYCWASDGKGGFTVTPATEIQAARLDGQRGTAVMLFLKDSASEFLLDEKIRQTIVEYSDHISVPIYIGAPKMIDQDAQAKPENSTSALWMKAPADIEATQYEQFYKLIAHGMDEPAMTSHWHAEGTFSFHAMLFVPTLRPWDLFDPSRKHFVKLYVRRVFISEDVEKLMYPWLRFMRGIIDSEDLPLNISRESLQYNPLIEKIRNAVARRILSDMDKLAQRDAPGFHAIWGQFGAVVKEGLYDAPEHRAGILKLCRFASSHGEGLHSLEEYKARMKPGQDRIYYLSGESANAMRNSPQLEGFKARGLEVIFMTDTIDDFWLQQVPEYMGIKFQSITKGDIDLSGFAADKAAAQAEERSETVADIDPLLAVLNTLLAEKVDHVRKSQRLEGSPVCLVAADQGIDMHMERVLKLHQKYEGESKPVLEINPAHPLIIRLAEMVKGGADVKDAGYLLLDQARIIQGEPLDDIGDFARRLSQVMQRALEQ